VGETLMVAATGGRGRADAGLLRGPLLGNDFGAHGGRVYLPLS
jgi:hypothetical protein